MSDLIHQLLPGSVCLGSFHQQSWPSATLHLHTRVTWLFSVLPEYCPLQLFAHLSLLNTLHTQTSVSQHGFPYLFFIYFCVFFKMTFVHTYMINCHGTRFPTVFCHFTCPTPFSACYASTAETYFMAAHILEVHHVWLTLC